MAHGALIAIFQAIFVNALVDPISGAVAPVTIYVEDDYVEDDYVD